MIGKINFGLEAERTAARLDQGRELAGVELPDRGRRRQRDRPDHQDLGRAGQDDVHHGRQLRRPDPRTVPQNRSTRSSWRAPCRSTPPSSRTAAASADRRTALRRRQGRSGSVHVADARDVEQRHRIDRGRVWLRAGAHLEVQVPTARSGVAGVADVADDLADRDPVPDRQARRLLRRGGSSGTSCRCRTRAPSRSPNCHR